MSTTNSPIYYPVVAQSPNTEIEDDQPLLNTNNSTFYDTYAKNHYWENENPDFAGGHKNIGFVPQATIPTNTTDYPMFWGGASSFLSNLGQQYTQFCKPVDPNIAVASTTIVLVPKAGTSSTWPVTVTISGLTSEFVSATITAYAPLITDQVYYLVPLGITFNKILYAYQDIPNGSSTWIYNKNYVGVMPAFISNSNTDPPIAYNNAVLLQASINGTNTMPNINFTIIGY